MQGSNLAVVALMASAFRQATPLIFAALGGIFSERSGVVNIALEGIMLVGAFSAMTVSYYTGSPWLGVLGAIIAGIIIAAIHAVISIEFRADQVVSGVAINMFALGFTNFMLRTMFHSASQSPSVNKLDYLTLPLISRIPVIGSIIGKHIPLVYLALLMVVAVHFFMFRTPWGLKIRAVGEHPEAADSLGINVKKVRFLCVLMSGVFAGIGGATLSIGLLDLFVDNMTAGRGFIALAAMIFGKWYPFGALGAALLFGFADALQMLGQTLGITLVPKELLMMAPYIITILALVGVIGRATPPASIGKPYEKE